MCKAQVRLFKRRYQINGNENEAENEKTDHKDTTKVDLFLDMDSNILNVKCTSV